MASDLTTMGQAAQTAETQLAQLSTTQRNAGLTAMAQALVDHQDVILAANQADLTSATDLKESFVDRLTLTADRIEAMAEGMRQVAQLPDPIGSVDKMWKNEAGLMIGKQRVPLGVIGIIFEARPNVTADAAALCFKSGNAVMLRGGKEAIQTNIAVSDVLRQALTDNGVDANAIQLVHDTSHETASEMMALTGYLDVLIPRGGRGLIQRVVQQAKVPVIETGAGNCHIYVDEFAELQMAIDITVNAKVQRPSVCNAAEKLVIHSAVAADYLPAIAAACVIKAFNYGAMTALVQSYQTWLRQRMPTGTKNITTSSWPLKWSILKQKPSPISTPTTRSTLRPSLPITIKTANGSYSKSTQPVFTSTRQPALPTASNSVSVLKSGLARRNCMLADQWGLMN